MTYKKAVSNRDGFWLAIGQARLLPIWRGNHFSKDLDRTLNTGLAHFIEQVVILEMTLTLFCHQLAPTQQVTARDSAVQL